MKTKTQHYLRLTLSTVLFLSTVAGVAQKATPSLTFEVATVKPSEPLDMQKVAAQMQSGIMPKIGPHVTVSKTEYNYMTLKDLIAVAYKVKGYQITGPDWLGGQRFDILARMPEGSSKDDAPAMLRALLEDRFKLETHRDSQEHPVLGLVVGKGGPKLKESTGTPTPLDENAPLKPGEMKMDTPNGPALVTRHPDGSSTINMGVKGIITQRMDAQTRSLHLDSSVVTMEGFADMLTSLMEMDGGGARQVVDMTGLKGNYQVAVEVSLADIMAIAKSQGMDLSATKPGGGAADPNAPTVASDPGGAPTVFESVQALGLKLEPRKANVEQLVVDHAEKMPTEN